MQIKLNTYSFDNITIPSGALPQTVRIKPYGLPFEEESKTIKAEGMDPGEQNYFKAILQLGEGKNLITYFIANSECSSPVTLERPEGRRGLQVTINECAGCLLKSECAFIPGYWFYGTVIMESLS